MTSSRRALRAGESMRVRAAPTSDVMRVTVSMTSGGVIACDLFAAESLICRMAPSSPAYTASVDQRREDGPVELLITAEEGDGAAQIEVSGGTVEVLK